MVKEARPLLDACLASLLGSTNAISTAFEHMGWAEDEIEQAKRRHPEHAEEINSMFLRLCPGDVLIDMAEPVIRRHMSTLLDRVPAGTDTEAATLIECACVLSRVSMKAPLNRPTCWIMWAALRDLMSDGQVDEPHLDDYERNHQVPELLLDCIRAMDKALPPEELPT